MTQLSYYIIISYFLHFVNSYFDNFGEAGKFYKKL